jgi:hypothetical protein
MRGSVSGAWNEAVFEILAQKLLAMNKNLGLSQKPPTYIKTLLHAKFRRCRHHWNRANPRKLANGTWENIEEIENRGKAKKEEELKRQRHHTRLLTVSYKSMTSLQ